MLLRVCGEVGHLGGVRDSDREESPSSEDPRHLLDNTLVSW